MSALLLIAALAGPSAASPAHSQCLFTRAGESLEGSCGPLFGETQHFEMRPEKDITTGAWRRDLHPVTAWAVEAKDSEALSQAMELEVYSGGSGVFRTPMGWFAVSGFVLTKDTLRFDLDVAQQVPPNELDRAIVERAAAILSSDAVWNRADDRQCRPDAKTWSIDCALERATTQLTGGFHHRRPALEIVRAIVDERTTGRPYQHRLMDYNNDPSTHLKDVESLFTEAVGRIEQSAPPTPVRLEMKTLAPEAHSTLNQYSTLIAVLDYQVENFEPGKYFVQISLASNDPGTLKVATDGTLPRQWALRKSDGSVKVSQPLLTFWKDKDLAHPLKVYFQLNERVDGAASRVLLTLGPFEYQE